MKPEERYFSIDEFLNALDTEITSPDALVKCIEEELQRKETLKIRIVEENAKSNPEAMVRISRQIDAYIFRLQHILTELLSRQFSQAVISEPEIRQLRKMVLNKIRESEQLD